MATEIANPDLTASLLALDQSSTSSIGEENSTSSSSNTPDTSSHSSSPPAITVSSASSDNSTSNFVILPFRVTAGFEGLANELLKLGVEKTEDVHSVILFVQDILYSQKNQQLILENNNSESNNNSNNNSNSSSPTSPAKASPRRLHTSTSEEIVGHGESFGTPTSFTRNRASASLRKVGSGFIMEKKKFDRRSVNFTMGSRTLAGSSSKENLSSSNNNNNNETMPTIINGTSNSPTATASSNSLEAELGSLEELLDTWTVEEREENKRRCRELFDELVGQERKFVNVLQYIVENWLVPLRTAAETNSKGKIFEGKEILLLFSNVEIIYHNHTELLNAIQQSLPENVASLFVKRIPNLSVYSQYVNNWISATAVMEKHHDYLTKNSGGVELASLLAQLLTRVEFYIDHFKKSEAVAPPNSQQRKSTMEVVTKLTNIAKKFSKLQQDSENQAIINHIKKLLVNYPGEFASPGRVLLHEGDLILWEGPKKNLYRFFLFNDILMYVKTSTMPIKQLKFKGQIELRKAEIVTRSQSFSTRNIFEHGGGGAKIQGSSPQDIKNAIQIMSGDTMLSLCAHTFPEREEWLKILLDTVDTLYQNRLFGIPLYELSRRKRMWSDGMPIFLRMAFDYFLNDKNAMETEGIFRVAASQLAVESYRETIDSGNMIDFSSTDTSPHIVANLIKLYFRDLPDPLLTYGLFDRFCEAKNAVDRPSCIEALKPLIKLLPAQNQSVLKHLSRFLRQVSSHAEANKMNNRNIAIVFEPNLLRRKTDALNASDLKNNQKMFDTTRSIASLLSGEFIVEILLQYYDAFFDS